MVIKQSDGSAFIPEIASVKVNIGNIAEKINFYTGTAESAALYEQLSRQLPVFMLPRTLERLEHMPLTANGKADRRRLLAIARRETT